jgi:GAF domain-containing protein
VPSKAAALAEGLCALAQFFMEDGTLADTLQRVAELACEVSAADMAGLTLLADGKPSMSVFTCPEASEIDNCQYGSGHGPWLDAFRDQRDHRINSTTDDSRWPDFSRAAAAHGIVAALSVPVIARGESIGALNLYSRTSAFDDDAAGRVAAFAQTAAIVLANAQVYSDAVQLNENMAQAMSSRSSIDQAIGILMADGGRTPELAFQLLVRASQRENRKLRDIAGEMVSRVASRAMSA